MNATFMVWTMARSHRTPDDRGAPTPADFHSLLEELMERQAELQALDLFSDERRFALARVESLMDRLMASGLVDPRPRPGRTASRPSG